MGLSTNYASCRLITVHSIIIGIIVCELFDSTKCSKLKIQDTTTPGTILACTGSNITWAGICNRDYSAHIYSLCGTDMVLAVMQTV